MSKNQTPIVSSPSLHCIPKGQDWSIMSTKCIGLEVNQAPFKLNYYSLTLLNYVYPLLLIICIGWVRRDGPETKTRQSSLPRSGQIQRDQQVASPVCSVSDPYHWTGSGSGSTSGNVDFRFDFDLICSILCRIRIHYPGSGSADPDPY